MVDRNSAKRILNFAVMKMSPDKTPPGLKTSRHRGPKSSPLSGSSTDTKKIFNKVYPSPTERNQPKTFPSGNGHENISVKFVKDPAGETSTKLKTAHHWGLKSPSPSRFQADDKARYLSPTVGKTPKTYKGGNRRVNTTVNYFQDPAKTHQRGNTLVIASVNHFQDPAITHQGGNGHIKHYGDPREKYLSGNEQLKQLQEPAYTHSSENGQVNNMFVEYIRDPAVKLYPDQMNNSVKHLGDSVKTFPSTNGQANISDNNVQEPAKLENEIFSPVGTSWSNQEHYYTPCTSPSSLYRRSEPKDFEDTIRKVARVVAIRENMKVRLDRRYLEVTIYTSVVDALHDRYSPEGTYFNGIFVHFSGDELIKMKMMGKGIGFKPALDDLLLKYLREAAYPYNWSDLCLLANGNVCNRQIFLSFRSAIDRFIVEGLMMLPNIKSP